MPPGDSETPTLSDKEESISDKLKIIRTVRRARRVLGAKRYIAPVFRRDPFPEVVLPSDNPLEDIHRNVAKLIAWANAVPISKVQPQASEQESATPVTPRTDGPDGGRWVWWMNRRHEIPK